MVGQNTHHFAHFVFENNSVCIHNHALASGMISPQMACLYTMSLHLVVFFYDIQASFDRCK